MATPSDPDKAVPLLELDGATLEGGGQLVRNALALSALTSTRLHISKIRGNRPKAGGLKSSHSAAVTFMAHLCGATVHGAGTGSQELLFEPPTPGPDATGKTHKRNFSIGLSSPGSIFLIFQAVYPYLLFSSGIASTKPVTLTIAGGTNVTFSPSYEYFSQVLLPILTKLGLPPLTATLQRRGWTTGKMQIGSVAFNITPLAPGVSIPAFSLTERGPIVRILISVLACGNETRTLLREEAVDAASSAFREDADGDVEVEVAVDEDSGSDKRLYLLVVAESAAGYRLGRDWLYDQKISNSSPKATARKLVKKVIKDLKEEVGSGACIDEHMRDQVVLFQALAEGRSTVDGGQGEESPREPSLHARTAEWVAEEVLGVRFDSEGRCEGVGLTAGQMFGITKRSDDGGDDEGDTCAKELENISLEGD